MARGSGQGLVGQECLGSDSPERGGSASIELTDDRWEELRCEVLLPNPAPAPSLASRCEPIHPIRYFRAERIRGLFFLSTGNGRLLRRCATEYRPFWESKFVTRGDRFHPGAFYRRGDS